MKKIYIHPLPVRIWHWVNALGFLFMILTGLELRYPELFAFMPFKAAVQWHNRVGFLLIGNYFLWLLFYLFSDKIVIYHPELSPKKHFDASIRQVLFYGRGIFVGEENPFHPTAYNKFNPMQKMAYQVLMMLAVPIQFATGVLLWDVNRFAGAVSLLGGVRVVDTLHVLLFIFFSAFLFVHFYLATLGHTPMAHFKAMFTGYEEIPEKGDHPHAPGHGAAHPAAG